MIDVRANGVVRVLCDRQPCTAEHAGNELAISAALTAAKGAGWRVLREGGAWVHLCPHHKGMAAKAQGRGLL